MKFKDLFLKPQAKWLPSSPYWWRLVTFNIRNPFGAVLALVATDKMLPDIPTFNPKGGFEWIIHRSHLPFISYRGKWVEWYVGWRPDGIFGIAVRHSHAKGA